MVGVRLRSKRGTDHSDRPRILVVIRGHIADLFEAMPALRALRDRYPHGRITVLANEYTRGMLDDCPYVDKVIYAFTYQQRTRARRLGHMSRVVASIAGRYDIAICLRSTPPGVVGLAALSGARTRVGFDQPRIWGRLLTHNAGDQPDDVPNREVNLAPLRTLDIEGRVEYEPLTWIGREVVESAERLLTEEGIAPSETPYAVYQISANWGCNELRTDKWAEVIDAVYERHGLRPVILGSDDPFELMKCEAIGERVKAPLVSLLGRTTLPEAFSVIRGASLAVMTDSALGQVAIAQRTPSVIMFGVEPLVNTAPVDSERTWVEVIQHWDRETADTPNPNCQFGQSYCHSEYCRENSSLVRTTVEEITRKVASVLGASADGARSAAGAEPAGAVPVALRAPSGPAPPHNEIDAGRRPKVSVGLAVFNGEPYLTEAIDSILAQTFTDFELIISDNASTDKTEAICREYADRDPRIRYVRNARNIGGANNENQTFLLSRGEYFRWAAHDDVLAPTLLERCVEVLDADPSVVLVHPWVVYIDEDGNETERFARMRPPDLPTWRLFIDLTRLIGHCEESYGLMRSSALAATGLQRNYTDSDRTLLAHLTLLGGYREIDDYLFFKRFHTQGSTTAFAEWRFRMLWFGEEYASKINLPHWSQFFHYLAVIREAPVSLWTKVRCWAFMLTVWIATYRKWRSLGKDLLLATLTVSRRATARLAGRKELATT